MSGASRASELNAFYAKFIYASCQNPGQPRKFPSRQSGSRDTQYPGSDACSASKEPLKAGQHAVHLSDLQGQTGEASAIDVYQRVAQCLLV